MPSATNHQGIVREFHIVWRVVTLWIGVTSGMWIRAEVEIYAKAEWKHIKWRLLWYFH